MGLASEGSENLLQSPGEFFGDSSTAYFLKQIQSPAESGFNGVNPETNRSRCPEISTARVPMSRSSADLVRAYDLPPRQLADYLLDCYFNKIHRLYPFVHKPTFLYTYKILWNSEVESNGEGLLSGMGLGDPSVSPSIFHCALNILFALGCQFSKLDCQTRESTSEEFFQRAQRLLSALFLGEGSLALVQTLVLTAQYLQGDESPARCWNLIGLACRMAQGLGLHSLKADEGKSAAELQMRKRIWHGCVMLDLWVMLGIEISSN